MATEKTLSYHAFTSTRSSLISLLPSSRCCCCCFTAVAAPASQGSLLRFSSVHTSLLSLVARSSTSAFSCALPDEVGQHLLQRPVRRHLDHAVAADAARLYVAHVVAHAQQLTEEDGVCRCAGQAGSLLHAPRHPAHRRSRCGRPPPRGRRPGSVAQQEIVYDGVVVGGGGGRSRAARGRAYPMLTWRACRSCHM